MLAAKRPLILISALVMVVAALSMPRLIPTTQSRVFLWAWERPEDLRFLDPARFGVAFLAATLHLHDGELITSPRRHPLRLGPGTEIIPVVRIETDITPLTAAQLDAVAHHFLRFTDQPNVIAAQIDFDATVSQRPFYRSLVQRLHTQRKLSITALASWCLDDPWIKDLPVIEAVPMLFRMGPESRSIRQRLAGGSDFSLEICRSSYGLSTDESPALVPAGRRLYLFHPQPWTPRALP